MEQTSLPRALVTGGTGFVGSHLVELLLRRGYSVTCLVRDPTRTSWVTGANVEFVKGDCSHPDSLVSAVQTASIVFHVAGLTKAKHVRDYYLVNHTGTRNVLDACFRHNPGIRKFVLISSLAAVGPSPDGAPVRDTDIAKPVSDYGRSKLLGEEETLRYKDKFPVAILRPSAVYGPRDRDMFELFRWASRGLTLEIAGGDRYICPCYVEDLASAIVSAAEKQTESGSIYYIAESRSYSWTDFRDTLLAAGGIGAFKLKVPYQLAYLIGLASEVGTVFTGRPSITSRQKVLEASQRYWICDTRKTELELDWSHSHSLIKGLEVTWQWYRDNNWLR